MSHAQPSGSRGSWSEKLPVGNSWVLRFCAGTELLSVFRTEKSVGPKGSPGTAETLISMVPGDSAWEGLAIFMARIAVKLTARVKALYAKFQ